MVRESMIPKNLYKFWNRDPQWYLFLELVNQVKKLIVDSQEEPN